MRGWSEALRTYPGAARQLRRRRLGRRRGSDAGTRLARDPSVTAVFAANDQTALGVIRGLHDAGRRVPQDVSVVGFDDTPESGYFLPPLTTMRQDFGEVGRRSVELLLSLAEGHRWNAMWWSRLRSSSVRAPRHPPDERSTNRTHCFPSASSPRRPGRSTGTALIRRSFRPFRLAQPFGVCSWREQCGHLLRVALSAASVNRRRPP